MAWSAPNFGANSFVVDQSISPDGTKIYAIVSISGTYSVNVITVSSGAVAATLTLTGCHTPKRVIFRPDGVMAYVLDVYGLVYPITVSSNTVGTSLSLGTGGTQGAIAVSPDSATLAVAGAVGMLTLISTASFTVTATFATGASIGGDSSTVPSAVALTNTTAYLCVNSNVPSAVPLPQGLLPITIATATVGTLIRFGIQNQYATITPDGNEIWVTAAANPYIIVVSTATNTVTQTIGSTHSSGIGKLVFNGNGTRAFGISVGAGTVYEFERASYAEISTTVSAAPYINTNFICLSPYSTALYYAGNNGTTASYVEQATGIFSAPSTPVLGVPYLTVYAGVTCVAFPATVASTDGELINAAALRIKLGAGSYGYLNQSALTISSVSAVWNTLTPNLASSTTLTLYVPTSLLTSGTYSWSIAGQEAGANLQSSFATDSTSVVGGSVSITATAIAGATGVNPPMVRLAVTTSGLSSDTTISLQIVRSDGQYVRGAGWEGNTSIAPGVGTATVNDPECVPATSYTYTAFVTCTGSGPTIVLPSTSSSVQTSAANQMWLWDPTSVTSAVGFNLGANWAPKIHEQGALFAPLGYKYYTKSTDGTKGYGGTLPIRTTSLAQDAAVVSLCENVGVLFLATPRPDGFWITWNPSTDRQGSMLYTTLAPRGHAWASGTPFNDTAAEYVQADRP